MMVTGVVLSMFFSAAADITWTENYNGGLEQAAAAKKPVFLLFTGSDWCPTCMELEKNILSSREFQDYAAAKLISIKVDFPRKRPQMPIQSQINEELSQKFAVEGFPTMFLLDSKGRILKNIEYTGQTPEEFVKELESATATASEKSR